MGQAIKLLLQEPSLQACVSAHRQQQLMVASKATKGKLNTSAAAAPSAATAAQKEVDAKHECIEPNALQDLVTASSAAASTLL